MALIWGCFPLLSWPQVDDVWLSYCFFLQTFPCSAIMASFTLVLTSSRHQVLLAGFRAAYFWLESNFYGYFLFLPLFLNIPLSHKYCNRL